MSKKETRVFLGNLPPDVRIRDIEDFFHNYGKVKNVLIKQCKYGFAEFERYRDAEDAVHDMHGKKLKGSRINVEFAKGHRFVKEKRRAPWVAKYGAPERTKYKLRVTNLSSRISWQDLKDIFRKAGEVTYVEAHNEKLHEARVDFATLEDLERVFERYQDHKLNGRRIELFKEYNKSRSRSKEKSESPSGKSRSKSNKSRSRSESRTRTSRYSRSYSRELSESRASIKKVDIEDKDVKRLRKRSHSRENRRTTSMCREGSNVVEENSDNNTSPKPKLKKLDNELSLKINISENNMDFSMEECGEIDSSQKNLGDNL